MPWGCFAMTRKAPLTAQLMLGAHGAEMKARKSLSEMSARCPNPMTQCQKLPFRDQKKSLCQTHWPGFPLPAVKAPPPPPPAARWLTGPRQVPSVRERLTFALHARGRCLVVPFRIWRKARLVLSQMWDRCSDSIFLNDCLLKVLGLPCLLKYPASPPPNSTT